MAAIPGFFNFLKLQAMPDSSFRIFRIAVAGTGLIGRRHIELLQASSRTALCAVVDPTPAAIAFAQQLGVPHFSSLEELFLNGDDDKPDGAILATPNHLHVAGALACAENGVSAIIEKPVADTLASGRRLVAALERVKVPMLVGHHRRHSSTLQMARRAIQSGRLGKLVTVMGSAQFYKPDSYFEQGAWRKDIGGGPILINLIHEMDNLRYLCGEVESVHAVASSAVRGFAVEDTVVMTLRFTNGTLGTFVLSDTVASPRSWEQTSGENAAYPRYPSEDCYFIAGTQGSLAVPTLRTWGYARDGAEAGWWTPFVEETLALEAVDPLAAQLDHFCDLMAGKTEPVVSITDALQSLMTVEAVRQSIATGETVLVGDLA
jgi:predicted dehydrogenase